MSTIDKYLPLITLGFGQTDGGECRVMRWTRQGAQVIGKFRMTFTDIGGAQWYDGNAVATFWDRIKADESTLRRLIFRGDCRSMGGSYWGADLAFLDSRDFFLGGIPYTTAMQSALTRRWIDSIPCDQWHTELGGASQAAYQPLGILAYMSEYMHPSLWKSVTTVVPMTDYLFWLLTRHKWHDAIMLQSQGLRGSAASAVEKRFGAPLPTGALCPWTESGPDNVECVDGVICAPLTHDSPMARNVAFSTGVTYGVWTGSWLGVMASLDETSIAPCDTTRQLNLSFEGLAPPALQKNTSFSGAVYSAMVKKSGISYDRAAQAAIEMANSGVTLPTIDVSKFASMSMEAAMAYVEGIVGEPVGVKTITVVLQSTAQAVWNDLQKLAQVIGKPLEEVGMVGGFVKNPAFLQFLANHGVKIKVPRHAAFATDVGVAADVIRRAALHDGNPMQMAEILDQLPALTG